MGIARAAAIGSFFVLGTVIACSSAGGDSSSVTPSEGAGGAAGAGGDTSSAGGSGTVGGNPGFGGFGGSGVGGATTVFPDPVTCDEAAASHTYLGCDFWPTIVDNVVQPTFDFAAVVANTQAADATVTVTRGGKMIGTATVPANGLLKLYLPWVEELKSLSWLPGQPDNGCATFTKTNTVRAPGGAYHLTSSLPVAVYQFNAIEYAGKGGPPGKNWGTCKTCAGLSPGCYSYSNDASLLLPTTALTPNYRIAGPTPWKPPDSDPNMPSTFAFPTYFAITGTVDGTMVTVQMSSTGTISAGGGVTAIGPGQKTTFAIDAGEVVMVVGSATADLSGSLVKASAPVQVVSGIACSNIPHDVVACDHLEETVLPVETLGQRYFVTQPTASAGNTVGHVVRLIGNVDGTKLTYPGATPSGAPSSIDAGEVVDLGVVTTDFEIVGDHELLVSSFQIGQGPMMGARLGDPSMSFISTVPQFRVKYSFLAPDDYDVSFVDVVQPMDATVTIDGAPITAKPTAISSGYGVARVKLGPGNGGAHVLTSSAPVGIQVMGYGAYTSYQYPGGLNLGVIAPIPPLK